MWISCRQDYRGKQKRKNTAALAADVIGFSSAVLSLKKKKKRKTDTRNMFCCAILFCTFPEIQGVGYRKNPVREGRSAFSVRGLEKPLGRMEGKWQGLSYFLSFFSLLSIIWEKGQIGGGRGVILLGVSQRSLLGRKQWQGDSGHICVLAHSETTAHASGAPPHPGGHRVRQKSVRLFSVSYCASLLYYIFQNTGRKPELTAN